MDDRKSQILALLRAQESVSIAEMTRHLQVSRETVRKDLYQLEVAGLLTKVRGGAVLTASNVETAYDLRAGKQQAAKRSIARTAAERVNPGDIVYLDYGTTTYLVAAELANIGDVTVVTNALPIVEYLARTSSVSVVVPGGVLRGNENSLYGPITNRSLRHLHFDIGFFGCTGLEPSVGFTNPHMAETEVSSLAVERSRQSVMVVDHSKYGVVAANVVCPIEEPDVLVTDTGMDVDAVATLEDRGLPVVTVDADTEQGEQS